MGGAVKEQPRQSWLRANEQLIVKNEHGGQPVVTRPCQYERRYILQGKSRTCRAFGRRSRVWGGSNSGVSSRGAAVCNSNRTASGVFVLGRKGGARKLNRTATNNRCVTQTIDNNIKCSITSRAHIVCKGRGCRGTLRGREFSVGNIACNVLGRFTCIFRFAAISTARSNDNFPTSFGVFGRQTAIADFCASAPSLGR